MPTRPVAVVVRCMVPALFMSGLAAAAPAQADEGLAAATAELPAVTVSSYPVPMLDVDGQSKYVAVVAAHGVEIRRCQHMVVTRLNYLACELTEGSKRYNVIIPIVREAVDVRQPWNYFQAGVYR